MGSVSTALVSTVVPLLLLTGGACSSYRCAARRDHAVVGFDQHAAPVAIEAPDDSTFGGRAAAPTNPPAYRPREPMTRRSAHLWSRCREGQCKLWTDCQHYCSWLSMRDLLLGVAAGSVLANTSLDEDYQDWYQEDVRSVGTDRLAEFWEPFGQGYIFIPAFACLALAGAMCEETPLGNVTGHFGGRTTRAYLVGAPPMLFMQYCLGGSRPGETVYESRWRPFEDNNGVSGHAFVGAVPFITAAKMTDEPCLKGGLYLCSALTAWSRVNDDAHYLSHACLGWWMAYLACDAVAETEYEDEYLTFTPVTTPEMVGVGMVYQR